MNVLLVALGAASGGVLRYLVSGSPLRTFIVNVAGSFLIGVLSALCPQRWRPFAIAGFCGGFTTFSTFSNETFRMLEDGHCLAAFAYSFGSLLTGVVAVAVGYWVAGAFK